MKIIKALLVVFLIFTLGLLCRMFIYEFNYSKYIKDKEYKSRKIEVFNLNDLNYFNSEYFLSYYRNTSEIYKINELLRSNNEENGKEDKIESDPDPNIKLIPSDYLLIDNYQFFYELFGEDNILQSDEKIKKDFFDNNNLLVICEEYNNFVYDYKENNNKIKINYIVTDSYLNEYRHIIGIPIKKEINDIKIKNINAIDVNKAHYPLPISIFNIEIISIICIDIIILIIKYKISKKK